VRPDYSATFYAVGVRDLRAGEWMSGYAHDLAVLSHKDYDLAYLGAEHLFNADEAGKGSLGLSLGVNTGKLGAYIEKALGKPAAPGWIGKLSDFVSVEIAGGYRIFGTPANRSPWVYGFGGKVRIPLGGLL
jgi:hypothetical protein